jgi:hypothetical protein
MPRFASTRNRGCLEKFKVRENGGNAAFFCRSGISDVTGIMSSRPIGGASTARARESPAGCARRFDSPETTRTVAMNFVKIITDVKAKRSVGP